MSSRSLIVKSPDGATAVVRSETPREGDELQNNGDTWTIEEVVENEDGELVVTLRPKPESPLPEADG